MADVIARFKADTSGFNTNLKQASRALNELQAGIVNTGRSFSQADEKEIEFIRSMGNMQSTAQSVKGQLKEYQNAINAITISYQNLSDSDKSTDLGKAMAQAIDQLTEKAGVLKDVAGDTAAAIANAASDTRAFDQIAGGVGLMTSAMQTGIGAAKLLGINIGDNVEVLAKLQAAMAVTNGLQSIQNALQKQSALMQGIATLQKKAAAAAEALHTSAVEANTVATKAATVAQRAFNAVAKANPYVLLASAALAAGAAIYAFSKNAKEATEEEKFLHKQNERLAESMKNFESTTGRAAGNVAGKFMALQSQWKALRNEGERTRWIQENANNFKSLGLSVTNVNKANDVFVKNAPKIISALKAIAVAQKISDKYAEEYANWIGRNKSTKTGDFYRTVHAGDKVERDEANAAGVIGSDYIHETRYDKHGNEGLYNTFKLNEAGVKKINSYRERKARELNKNLQQSSFGVYSDALEGAIRDAMDANQFLSSIGMQPANYSTKGGGHGGGISDTKKEVEDLSGVLPPLRKKLEELREAQEHAATPDIWKEYDKQIQAVQGKIDAFTGKLAKPAKEQPKEIIPVTQSLGPLQLLEEELKTVEGSMQNAANTEEWKTMSDYLETIKNQIKSFKGEITPVVSSTKEAGKAWQVAAQAINSAGSALQNMDNKGAKVAGIVAQAVANIALGFAQASASPATGASGVFGWIAAATAGLATMTATIASIKQSTKGFAEGGILGGQNYSGDLMPARVNSGEMIINQSDQKALYDAIHSGNIGGAQTIHVVTRGENTFYELRNYMRRTNKTL